jgi:phospho-2-dehydro-3-deoxyheptonate aldolase
MTQAPQLPSTEQLHASYPFGLASQVAVQSARINIGRALENHESETVGIIGYCARPGLPQLEYIKSEGQQISDLNEPDNGLHALHRGPMWKPRTSPNDWHGEETTDPEGAYITMHAEAELYANVAVEIGRQYHLDRYGHLLTFGWIGGRNVGNEELIEAAASHDMTLPLGIKNGLDGEIDGALDQVERARELRGEGGAPVILIYRGGTNAQSPEAWEEKYIEAYERTAGQLIVDTAHGSQMAHDPEGKFSKSVDGQVLSLHALLRLVREGYHPAGTIMEASDLESPTDPHMPLWIAIHGIHKQHAAKRNQLSYTMA